MFSSNPWTPRDFLGPVPCEAHLTRGCMVGCRGNVGSFPPSRRRQTICWVHIPCEACALRADAEWAWWDSWDLVSRSGTRLCARAAGESFQAPLEINLARRI